MKSKHITQKDRKEGIIGFVILAITIFLLFKFCSSDKKPMTVKEDYSSYVASEYFKANIISPIVPQDELISLAAKERLQHGDKEGGLIRFYENPEDTLTANTLWAYVEYHYPDAPDKVNAKDEFGRPITVKIFR